jgi:periplasmic protein TonB
MKRMARFEHKHARVSSRTLMSIATAALVPALLAGCGKSGAPAEEFIPSTQVIATQTPPPDYPLEVACAGIGGTTVLTVTVGVEGKPTDVVLKHGSGNEALDKAALERVPSWQFIAATRRGQPVPMSIQVPVNFKPPAVRPDACFKLD